MDAKKLVNNGAAYSCSICGKKTYLRLPHTDVAGPMICSQDCLNKIIITDPSWETDLDKEVSSVPTVSQEIAVVEEKVETIEVKVSQVPEKQSYKDPFKIDLSIFNL